MGASPNLSKSSKSTGIGKSNAVLVVFQVLADNKIRGSGAFPIPALFNESMEVGSRQFSAWGQFCASYINILALTRAQSRKRARRAADVE